MQKSRLLLLAITALLVLTSNALVAQPPTTNFLLNGVGSGQVLAGVYTSPYSGQINGGATTSVICDDFADDSFVPEQWTTYVTSMSDLTLGTWGTPDPYVKWLTTPGSTVTVNGQTLNQSQAYTVAAVLAVDIMQSSGILQEDYSYALWELFDAPHAFSQLTAYGKSTTQAQNDLNNAVSYALNPSNSIQVQTDVQAVTIYSYDASAGSPTGACGGLCPQPQEFLTVKTPEPSTWADLSFNSIGIGVIGLVFWRRKARKPS